jgi:hypothetical protein
MARNQGNIALARVRTSPIYDLDEEIIEHVSSSNQPKDTFWIFLEVNYPN